MPYRFFFLFLIFGATLGVGYAFIATLPQIVNTHFLSDLTTTVRTLPATLLTLGLNIQTLSRDMQELRSTSISLAFTQRGKELLQRLTALLATSDSILQASLTFTIPPPLLDQINDLQSTRALIDFFLTTLNRHEHITIFFTNTSVPQSIVDFLPRYVDLVIDHGDATSLKIQPMSSDYRTISPTIFIFDAHLLDDLAMLFNIPNDIQTVTSTFMQRIATLPSATQEQLFIFFRDRLRGNDF